MNPKKLQRAERYEKVRQILEALPDVNLVKSMREPDDLPRVGLHAALERFIEGSNDCIFHAAFAAEMALTLRLDKALSAQEKATIKEDVTKNRSGLMFGRVIKLAEKKSILSETDAKKAWKLNNLRNMYAHPANWLALMKQQYTAATNLEKEMPDLSALLKDLLKSVKFQEDTESVKKKLETMQQVTVDYVKGRMDKLPDLDWCASQDTLKFQEKRVKNYYKDSIQRILSNEGLTELLRNADNFVTYSQTTYAYTGRDEYEAIICAYEILKSISAV